MEFFTYIEIIGKNTKTKSNGEGKFIQQSFHFPENSVNLKILCRQGSNARKVISECTHFLYCSVLPLGGKVNTRWMSQPDMESIFRKMIYEIFWSKETIK